MAWTQEFVDNLIACNIFQATSTIMKIFHFAIGMYGIVNWWRMPWVWKKFLNQKEKHFPLHCPYKIFYSFFIFVFSPNSYILEISWTFSIFLSSGRHKNYGKNVKYLAPPREAVYIGPHTFECTNFNITLEVVWFAFGNGVLCCLPIN
jgi:hypothetical protein